MEQLQLIKRMPVILAAIGVGLFVFGLFGYEGEGWRRAAGWPSGARVAMGLGAMLMTAVVIGLRLPAHPPR